MTTVKYRLFEPRLNPRRTKMEVPGWAGEPEPRRVDAARARFDEAIERGSAGDAADQGDPSRSRGRPAA